MRPDGDDAADQGAGSRDYDAVYPKALREGEDNLLHQRRRKERQSPLSPHVVPKHAVGFGLSGGGIRSATFCLGLFQGMAGRRGLLDQIDFLSTVSGGGYFGSFLGRLFTRDYVKSPADVEAILRGEKKPQVLAFLRENGRYLSPNGGGDTLLFGAVILRNLVSIHLVLAVFVLAILLGLQLVRVFLETAAGSHWPAWLQPSAGALWWSPFVFLPVAVFALVSFPLGWAYWLVETEKGTVRKGARATQESAGAGPGPSGSPPPAPRAGGRVLAGAAARLAKSAVESSPIPPLAGLALVFVTCLWLAVTTAGESVAWLWGTIAASAVITVVFWLVAKAAVPVAGADRVEAPNEEPMDVELFQSHAERNLLGRWLTVSLVVAALLFVVALVDTFGQTLYLAILGDGVGAWLAGFASTAALVVAFSQRIAVFFSKGSNGKRPPLPIKWLASAAALLLVGLLLVGLSTAAHAIAWELDRPPGAHKFLAALEPAGEKPLTVVLPRTTQRVAMTLRNTPAPPVPREGEREVWPAFLGFAGTFLLSILFGQTWPFVNRSTQQPTYGARLTRAYLGASNERRWAGNNVTQPVAGDDYDLARYWPPPAHSGTPIHLINVTINETVDGHSQVQQQDRKGLGMALGPRGLSAGARHHAVMRLGDDKWMDPTGAPVEIFPGQDLHRVFRYDPALGFTGEMLPLGTWLSISGAAFSTGTGMRTSLGLSLLTGLGNVRLGRWWDSGAAPIPRLPPPAPRRKWSLRFEDWAAIVFPVQTYLLDEMLARFPGTARRHWYLSDGGHFENLGGYELIRRRLPLIVIVDAEMDAEYSFGGLANLIRKARLDFGAEITFLDEAGLDAQVDGPARACLGTLDQLRRIESPDLPAFSRAHASLARVSYPSSTAGSESSPRSSWLLYVKPTLSGNEPADVLEYHRSHPKFPHEPTADQFFDEAQWESYRRLGEHVAQSLFGEVDRFLDESGKVLPPSSETPPGAAPSARVGE